MSIVHPLSRDNAERLLLRAAEPEAIRLGATFLVNAPRNLSFGCLHRQSATSELESAELPSPKGPPGVRSLNHLTEGGSHDRPVIGRDRKHSPGLQLQME